ILKALSKDPARRYTSARELRTELRALAGKAAEGPRSVRRRPGDDAEPMPNVPRFERNDAIDVDDIFSLDLESDPGPAVGMPPEQAWIVGERQATALAKDPAPVLAELAALSPEAFAKQLPCLERALTTLASRGDAVTLLAVTAHVEAGAST